MNKSKRPQPTATPTGLAAVAPPTKRYDEAFKKEAVENWRKTGQSGTKIAAELGVSYPSLKDWKRRSWGDATPQRATLEEENRALRAERARVRAQRDMLKKTVGLFSEPSKTATPPSNA